MATQTVHRQKKPFQPSITSYFGRVDRDEYDHSRASALQQPVLESSVQSDLLSVGMRIRKAVPEGYKTHKTMLFYDSTPATSNAASYTMTRTYRSAELLPFCGLHKVGGHSVQDLSQPVDAHGPIDIFADDRTPFSLSQESTISTLSTDSMPAAPMLNPLTKNKRRYFDDEEEDDEDIPPFQLHFSDPLNPLLAGLSMSSTRSTYLADHVVTPDLATTSTRAMAKPKSRRKGQAVIVPEPVTNDIDFEEAPFLEPWELAEVEMGGT